MLSFDAAEGPLFRTAQAAVATRLRREILSGRLAPGERLLQSELAARMQTSTTPVREAIRELSADGLLDGDPHRGVTVHVPTPSELEELYELRLLIEPVCMAKAAQNRTDDDVERMTTHLAAMERTADTGTWTIGNAQFHAMLADAARAPQTAAVLDKLRNRSALYVATYLRDRPNLITEANQEHRDQLRACVEQDVSRIRTITKRHLTGTLRWARRALKDSDGPAVTTSLG